MRLGAFVFALATLALVACSTPSAPPPPTSEPFTALHVVRTGPYPLYKKYGDWLGSRVGGLSVTQLEDQTIAAIKLAQVQNRVSPTDGLRLHSGCIFDVQSTRPDQQEASYLWAYGKVVRCDEPIMDGVSEPQMGVRPSKLRIFDGRLGYFPMRLLDPYQGPPPVRR
jgi:hypothetical protein